MNTTLRIRNAAAALFALSVLSAAPVHAQNETRLPADGQQLRLPADENRSYGAVASVHNARLLGEVLRDFGYNPDRLSVRQQERLDEARSRLFPGEASRMRLNRSQAVAVVYVALVYPRGTGGRGGGGWDDGDGWGGGDGWNDGRGRDRPGHGGRCADLDTGVYALLNLVSSDNNYGFIDGEEKTRAQATAIEVQSAAIARNYRQVADRAADVIASLGEWMPQRQVVRQRVNALKAAVDQACGDSGQR